MDVDETRQDRLFREVDDGRARGRGETRPDLLHDPVLDQDILAGEDATLKNVDEGARPHEDDLLRRGASRCCGEGENEGGGSGHENLRVGRRTLPARSDQGLLRSAR